MRRVLTIGDIEGTNGLKSMSLDTKETKQRKSLLLAPEFLGEKFLRLPQLHNSKEPPESL